MKKNLEQHYRKLDPCTLGRPIHLLPDFAAKVLEDFGELFRGGLNRRYSASFQAIAADIRALGDEMAGPGWRLYEERGGYFSCKVDREIVLSALNYRYGLSSSGQAGQVEALTDIPETTTEERMAGMLCKQFVETLHARIQSTANRTDAHPLKFKGTATHPRGGWLLKLDVRDAARGAGGSIALTLDEFWMDDLLRAITPEKPQVRGNAVVPQASLAPNLHLYMVARLLKREYSLGELFDMRIGDVIPISLGNTDVLINDARLFSATVAENKGKLCLTSFKDME
jgi:flagellar motor switch protein FliM